MAGGTPNHHPFPRDFPRKKPSILGYPHFHSNSVLPSVNNNLHCPKSNILPKAAATAVREIPLTWGKTLVMVPCIVMVWFHVLYLCMVFVLSNLCYIPAIKFVLWFHVLYLLDGWIFRVEPCKTKNQGLTMVVAYHLLLDLLVGLMLLLMVVGPANYEGQWLGVLMSSRLVKVRQYPR